MTNKRTVIFDLDGTLVDTVEDIANAVNDVMKKFDYPTHSLDFYKENIGGGINDLIDRSLPHDHNVTTESFIESLDFFYEEHLNKNTKVYPHIYEILDTLKSKDISIAVVSNKRHPFTVRSVNEYFAEYIDITIGSGSDYPLKPDPTSAQFVLKKFNCDPGTSYFVGDTGYDINTAKNAGMISIGVQWGMSNKEKLLAFEPDHLFIEPEDLLRFFKTI